MWPHILKKINQKKNCSAIPEWFPCGDAEEMRGSLLPLEALHDATMASFSSQYKINIK